MILCNNSKQNIDVFRVNRTNTSLNGIFELAQYFCLCQIASQGWDNNKLPQLQSGQQYTPAICRKVVAERLASFFDDAMHTKPLQQARYLRRGLPQKMPPEMLIGNVADVTFPAGNSDDKFQIVLVEKVKSWEVPPIFFNGIGQFLDIAYPCRRVFHSRNELEIPTVCCFHAFAKRGQAVDGLLHRRDFLLFRAVSVFYRPVVPEKGNVVCRRLYAKDEALLIVHLDGHGAHMMLDARPLDAGMEVIAELILVAAVQLAPKESRDIVALHGMYGCPGDVFVYGAQIALPPKYDVISPFALHDAPMVGVRKVSADRAERFSRIVQHAMECLDRKLIRQFLRTPPVVDRRERVVHLHETDAFRSKLGRQPVVAIAVELQPEWRPRRHTQIAQAEVLVDEIEIVVEALAVFVLQCSLVGRLVVPRVKRCTWLHCGKDMHETGRVFTPPQYVLDPVFLTERLGRSDKFDVNHAFRCNPLRVFTQFVAHRLDMLRVIKNADIVSAKIRCHPVAVTNTRHGASDDNPVKTGERSCNLGGVAFNQTGHAILSIRKLWRCDKKRIA